MDKKIYSEYCTGCGLCVSYFGDNLIDGTDGFSCVDLQKNPDILQFCKDTCVANGNHIIKQEKSTWGAYKAVYEGYAINSDVRYASASGGVTTAVAMFLIDQKYVDGVIQIGADENDPYIPKVYFSKTSQEVYRRSASRYITSSPLSRLIQILDELDEADGKIAFIGRPCDVIVLNNFLKWNPKYENKVYCKLSFFCAGVPSVQASKRLVNVLGVESDQVKSIRYRGNGWPGKATVVNKEGKEFCMDYINSWNNILGRDIRKMCKFCSDGVGEFADISNGDLWKLNDELIPQFDESAGVNVTFARTSLGLEVLALAEKNGYISLIDYQSKIGQLEHVQPNHAIRKKMLWAKMVAMRIMLKAAPHYKLSILKEFSSDVPKLRNIRTILGTIKRIVAGKIK